MARGKIHEQAQSTILLNGKQAEDEMKKLTTKADEFGKKKREAFEQNDLVAYKKWDNALKSNEKEQKNLIKATEKVIDVLEDLNGASIDEVSKAAKKATAELRKMKQTDPGYKEKEQQTIALNKRYREMSQHLRGIQTAGSSAFKSVTSFIKSNLLSLGSFALSLTGVFMILKNMITKTNQFEKAMSSLSAITGVTGKELDFYRAKSMEFSGQTLKSAKQIVEAFELVGSIRPELLRNKEALAEVTKQAIILSEATGGKLALEDAARATAGTLNQFSIESENANRVVNALAAGSKYGSANVVQITDAMKDFGTVAAQGNVTLEESVGLIETLAEKQIIGSEAGTKLRNILIILQGDQKNYKDGVFNLQLALENLASENMNVTELTKMFGKENLVAAQILMTSKDKVREYTEAVTGTSTALEQQAIQNNNVASMLTKLSTSWDTFMLKLNNSNGKLFEHLRFINAIMEVINKNKDENKELKLYNDDGTINDLKLSTLTMKELNEELGKLDNSKQIYFSNWQSYTGEEKAFWATHFDIVKENIEKVNVLIAKNEAEEAAKRKVEEEKRLAAIKAENEKAIELKIEMMREANERYKLMMDIMRDENGAGTATRPERMPEEENVPDTWENPADAMNTLYQEQLLILQQQRAQGLIDQEEYNTNELALETSHLILMLGIRQTTGQKTLDIEQKLAELGIQQRKTLSDDEKKLLDERLKEAQHFVGMYQNTMSNLGSAIVLGMQGNKDAMKGILRDMLFMWLDYLKKLILIKQVEILTIAMATWDSISTAGIAGAIKAAAIIAIVEAAFAGLKGAIGNDLYVGGYTPSGSWDEPKGIVHSNEFVGNRYATANPTVRPVLDIIDYAQRNGSISSLNLPAVMAASQGNTQIINRNSSSTINNNGGGAVASDPELALLIKQLNERLSQPIEAVVRGNSDYYREHSRIMDKYNKLNQNP